MTLFQILRRFRRNKRGVGAIEFALIAPALLGMLVGITQLGKLYFARADLRNAVAYGARQAQIYPRPQTTAISDAIRGKMVRIDKTRVTGPNITYATDANGFDYAQIEVQYAVKLNFAIYKPPPVTLIERRRVFLQPIS
ncbi:MAG TPA: TadE/TadG family type IV pilus assembly protein [Allosphingosinicella sp.]|jgi:Flp pilus assembly protein TadG